jgi:dihydrofolate reductase
LNKNSGLSANSDVSTDNAAGSKPQLVLIVAIAHDRVIGNNGQLPWHLSADLKRFKALTMGHPIIMGRKTYDSIGRILPGRRNIIVSRNAEMVVAGGDCVNSLRAALDLVADAEQVFIIGGEQIYQLALPLADRIELTEVDTTVAGDARFPEFDHSHWDERHREIHRDSSSGLRYDFVTLERAHR